ncbi:Undefined function [Listeria monocytogenes N53-1]|nr:Undefined function [Listeria monocytogenes]CCQ22497.1 Undefined function [Listeria monocytogenes N53-1]
MNKTIEMDGTTYDFTYEDLVWSITFPKSKTRAKELAQLELLEKPATHFTPAKIVIAIRIQFLMRLRNVLMDLNKFEKWDVKINCAHCGILRI